MDYDGDSLTLAEEQTLWGYTYRSAGRRAHAGAAVLLRRRAVHAVSPQRHGRTTAAGCPLGRDHLPDAAQQFLDWARARGYRKVHLSTAWDTGPMVRSRPHDRDGASGCSTSTVTAKRVLVRCSASASAATCPTTSATRTPTASSNYEGDNHGFMIEGATGAACYPKEKPFGISYAVADRDQDGVRDAATDADTDGDGIRDGADDEDHDDIPNVMELSRIAASAPRRHRRPRLLAGEPKDPAAGGEAGPLRGVLRPRGTRSTRACPTSGPARAPATGEQRTQASAVRRLCRTGTR